LALLKCAGGRPIYCAMTTPLSDTLLHRIDQLTGQLNPTVGRAGGAQFALMLSLIHQAQQLVIGRTASERDGAAVRSGGLYAQYSPGLVARMGRALQAGQRGELAMLISWADSVPARGVAPPAEAVPAELPSSLAQAALMAKSYGLLDEIHQSKLSVAA